MQAFSQLLISVFYILNCDVCPYRLEQPYMSLDSAFFSSLFNCRRLQRLCIIAKHSHFDLNDLMRAVEQVTKDKLLISQFTPQIQATVWTRLHTHSGLRAILHNAKRS